MKNIVIVGGGISGLALLHYLKQRYKDQTDVYITLLERQEVLGGTIQSVCKNQIIFETGPNGFLNNQPRTLGLIEELGLQDSLVKADAQAKIRYVSLNNTLHPLPTSPLSFLMFSLLNPLEKLRFFCEPFISKSHNDEESVFDFGKRRFGHRFAQLVLDPMVSGIYGGDAHKISLKEGFPKIYQWEQSYGSLFRAAFSIKKERRKSGLSKTALHSFREGMGELIYALGLRYHHDIHLNQEAINITRDARQYYIQTEAGQYVADEVFVCAPAYAATGMLSGLDPELTVLLDQIYYAPLAVVGLTYNKSAFTKTPKGFGYLIPSTENKKVLGVLIESNIFQHRCAQDQMVLRVMIGGARHPDILRFPKEEIISMALDEVARTFSARQEPVGQVVMLWKNAIPQYDNHYAAVKVKIKDQLKKHPRLHLVANYYGGISLNDCIENAYQAANQGDIYE